MKVISTSTKENWLSTINCLISSPLVHRFNIGITVNPNQRKKTYKYFTPSWPHFLIIQSGLNVVLALKAEKFLKDHLTKDKRSLHTKSTGMTPEMATMYLALADSRKIGNIFSTSHGAPSNPMVKGIGVVTPIQWTPNVIVEKSNRKKSLLVIGHEGSCSFCVS